MQLSGGDCRIRYIARDWLSEQNDNPLIFNDLQIGTILAA